MLEHAEKELIVRLTSTHGAQTEAARRMGLSRSALAHKLTKYEIRSTEQSEYLRSQLGAKIVLGTAR